MKRCTNIDCTCPCRSCTNMRQYRTLARHPRTDKFLPQGKVCNAPDHVESQTPLPLEKREGAK